MAIRIDEDIMTLTVDGEIVATARCAAAYGDRVWIVSTYPGRPLSRDQAITALSIANGSPHGFGDDDPFVKAGARNCSLTDRLIRITTALAVVAVPGVAAIISHQHAYEQSRPTARPASRPTFSRLRWTA